MRIPPVQIQNLNIIKANNAGTNNSSSGENQSMPASESEKMLDLNVQSMVIHQSKIGAPETRTPEPHLTVPLKAMANSASTNASLYEKLYKH